MLSEFASDLTSQDAELYIGEIPNAGGSGVGPIALRKRSRERALLLVSVASARASFKNFAPKLEH
jgi:hypothetical protein